MWIRVGRTLDGSTGPTATSSRSVNGSVLRLKEHERLEQIERDFGREKYLGQSDSQKHRHAESGVNKMCDTGESGVKNIPLLSNSKCAEQAP